MDKNIPEYPKDIYSKTDRAWYVSCPNCRKQIVEDPVGDCKIVFPDRCPNCSQKIRWE